MRRTWPVAVSAAGGLVLLVSLYLPWLQTATENRGTSPLFNLVPDLTVDGWSSGVGDAAALAALLLTGVAVSALVWPRVLDRLPLNQCALLAFYLGITVGAQARSAANQREIGRTGLHYHFAYGAYIGVAAALVVLLAAIATWRAPAGLARRNRAIRVAALAPAGGLLAAFLLPWETYTFPVLISSRGIASPPSVATAALVIWLLVVWWWPRWPGRGERLALSASATLFTVAAFTSLALQGTHAYGAWIGLGCVIALLALTVAADARGVRLGRPSAYGLATGSAAGLLIASLFLPWQQACYPRASDLGPFSGNCVSGDGWSTPGTVTAALSIVVILIAIAQRRMPVSMAELAAGIALLVATVGSELMDGGKLPRFELGYGSTVGFAAAALLVGLAAVRLRLPAIDRARLLFRCLPIAACLAYLIVVLLPWWGVLSAGADSALRFASPSWLTIAGLLVAIHLLRSWTAPSDATGSSLWLVLMPLTLLALATVDLVRLRDEGISWGGGIVVALSLLLALLGWIERQGGLENLRVPEILRVDRL